MSKFAEAQAKSAGQTLEKEIELLMVHGVLHLLGFDHRESDEKTIMFPQQDEILREWRSRS